MIVYDSAVAKGKTINIRVDEELKAQIQADAAEELQDVSGFFMLLYARYRQQKRLSSLPQLETPGEQDS